MKIFTFNLLFIVLFFCITAKGQTWQPVGPNDNNRPSDVGGRWVDAAVSPVNNNLYVCYMDASNAAVGIIVKQWNGVSWTQVGGIVPSQTGSGNSNATMAIHPITGEIYVAGLGGGNDVVNVFKLSGNNWIPVGEPNGMSTVAGNKCSLGITPAGIVYLAFQDYMPGVGYLPKLFKYTGTSWINIGNLENFFSTDIFSSDFKFEISAAGTLFVSYLENDNIANTHNAIVRKWNGTSWIKVGTNNIFADYRSVNNIVIDNNDVPYVVGIFEPSVNYCFCETVKKLNITTNLWEQVGNPAIVNSSYGQYDYEYADINLDASGIPYIAFKSETAAGYKMSVMKFDGTNWLTVGSPQFTIGPSNYINLLFNASNQPMVLSTDVACGSASPNTVIGDLVQAYQFNNTSWQLMGNNGLSNTGIDHFNFNIDKNKNIYAVGAIHYANSPVTNKPTVKRWNGTTWNDAGITQPIFNEPAYYSISSAVDDFGNLFVAYRNSNLGGYSVKKYTQATNTWSSVGDNITSAYYIYKTSIMVDVNNQPVVTANNVSGTPNVFRFNGTTWQTLTGSGVTGISTLMRGKGGAIIVANGSFIKKYNEANSTWNTIASTNLSGTTGINFTMDTTGISDTFYMARAVNYAANGGYIQTLKTYVGGSLTPIGNNFIPASLTDGNLSLAIGANSTPFIAYRKDFFQIGTAKLNKLSGTWEVITSALANGIGQADEVQLNADVSGDIYGMYNSSFLYLKKYPNSSVLPLRNLQAFAALKNNAVEVKWNWQDNNDTKNFEVEYSSNGNNFTKITELNATNISKKELSYMHTTAIAGKMYYRIKAIGINGGVYYSNIVSVLSNKDFDIVLNQNISSQEIVLRINSTSSQNILYKIINGNGTSISKSNIKTFVGSFNTTINIGNYAAGLYFLQVQNNKGEQLVFKFMKN